MKRVLVVDDTPNNLRLLIKLLKAHGYVAIEATTGEEGVKLAREEKPDLILMDIKLPDIDGVEATRRIRASEGNGGVTIVALTSYAMAGDREKFLDQGFNGYIEKPVDPFKIIGEVERYVR